MLADLTIKNYRRFEDTQPLRFSLEDNITALVGLNNAGKSSILRFFYELRGLWGALGSWTADLLHSAQGHPREIRFTDVRDPLEPFTNLNERNMVIEFDFPLASRKGPLEVSRLEVMITRTGPAFILNLWTPHGKVENIGSYRNNVLVSVSSESLADLTEFFAFFQALARILYIGPFRNALNVGATRYFDIDVGTAFIETWHTWQTGPTKKHNEAIQNVVRNIQHIFGYRDLQILAAKELNTLQVYADGRPYKLAELGGGITPFIVALGNAAIREPAFVLIDEPELNLHPALQLDFLTSLASYSHGRLFFATHSLGLARAGADRIYTVMALDGSSSVTRYEETPRLAEFLGELSFASFKELGFNKVLLVEGPTDIKTMQQFLRMVRKDHHVVTLPLGGTSMISADREGEMAELLRISSNVFVIIDSEKDHAHAPLQPRRRAFADMCRRLGIDTLVLERRAIENYLTQEAVQSELGSTFTSLQPYESLAKVRQRWDKQANWRIARRMTFDDIRNTDLGTFLGKL